MRKPNSPRTARRIAASAARRRAEAFRQMEAIARQANREFQEHKKELRNQAENKKLLSSYEKRAKLLQNRRTELRQQIIQHKRNLSYIKGIVGNFNGIANLNSKIYRYKIGSTSYGRKVYNIDPHLNVVVARVKAKITRNLQKEAERINTAVSQLNAQIAALEAQRRAAIATRPRV